MNVVTLLGRLTKDPEVRYTTGAEAVAVCRFTLAVARPMRHDSQNAQKLADFINITVFGRQAENCGKFLSKGREAAVKGRIQTGSYEKDGQRVYTTDVIAERVEFVGSRKDAPDNRGTVNEGKQMEIPEGYEAIDESEVPF